MSDASAADRVRAFYADYHARMGNTSGWPDMHDARLTYAAACREIDLIAAGSVLDVGSGEGHLLPFLRASGFRGAYVGVELLEAPHRSAVRRYGRDRNATFMHADFDALDLGDSRFDWVVSLGSLAVRQPDQAASDRRALKRMVDRARVGLALYVNDRRRVPPAWFDDMPRLAAHDLDALGELLAELGWPMVNLRWYAGDHGAMVHAHPLEPTND